MISLAVALAVLATAPQPSAKPVAPSAAVPDSAECHHPAVEAAAAKAPAEVILRGEKIAAARSAVKVGTLLADAAKLEGKTVVVEGTVRKACERKGCWMELATATDDKNPGVRVTFKDYGFFVPLDSAGAKARVEGVVKVAELSDARAKHYESEGALVPRDAAGKPREVQLLATGVELHR